MKRKIGFWVGIGLSIAAAIVIGIVIDLKRTAAAILQQHEAATLAKIAEITARSWPREVLFGDEVAGNRWDEYTKALDAFDAIPQVDLDELPVFSDSEPEWTPDPEMIDLVLERNRGCVDLLRAACRRRAFVPSYAYEDANAMDLSYLSKAIKASRYLMSAAERLHELGQDRDAADHVVLALVVGQDTGAGGPVVNRLVQVLCETNGIAAMRKILDGHGLSSKELLDFCRTLDRLRASRSRLFESFEIEDATNRLGITRLLNDQSGQASRFWGEIPKSWRHFYSATMMLAEALNEFERFPPEVAKVDGLQGPARRDAAADLGRRLGGSRNPVVSLILPMLTKTFRSEMLLDMKWNLMRTSLALAAYEAEHGAFPAKLEDLVPRYLPRLENCPASGKPVDYSPGKIWAFGGDWDDDAGRPAAEEDNDEADGDVVWTVKRK